MKLFMEHNYERLRDRSVGGVQPNLNLSIVRDIAVPLPPQGEQDRIVIEVEALLSSERHIQHELSTTERRVVRLRQAILKWAFEGKLVDQDPADEPADVLLARIRAQRSAAAPTGRSPRRPRRIEPHEASAS
jgi:type I restriction enzyme S subunit